MIALIVLALGMLASVIGIMAALDHGMLNERRAEAVTIAQQQAATITNTPFSQISSLSGTQASHTVYGQVRNAQIPYNVTTKYTPFTGLAGAQISEVTIEVTWSGREGGQTVPFSYKLETIVGQNQ